MDGTNVEARDCVWFALADAEHCRLLCCRLTRQGSEHVKQYGALKSILPEPEHARPGTNTGTSHFIEEDERRFAGQLVEWLRVKAIEHKIEHLVIFAPPRILGVLRKATSGLLQGHLEELKGDLMRLDTGQLAQHPMVRDLLPALHKRFSGGAGPATSRQASKSKAGQRKRAKPATTADRKAWRAGARVAGPASDPRSRRRLAATAAGHTGRTGRNRGGK